jgi:hypothetical protein
MYGSNPEAKKLTNCWIYFLTHQTLPGIPTQVVPVFVTLKVSSKFRHDTVRKANFPQWAKE